MRHALAMGYLSGKVFMAGALLQHFFCFLQSCLMSCACRQLPGCPQASLMASIPSGNSLRFLPLMLRWFQQCTSTSKTVTKSCAATGCTTSWAPWQRLPIQEKRPVEFVMAGAKQICLFASRLSVWRENADRRAVNSQGSCFSKERVISCSWLFAHGREKHNISLSCDVARKNCPR